MIRPELLNIQADYHGAIDFAEIANHGILPDQVIDFSVNSNPYGPHQSVLKAMQQVPADRYPDKACIALRNALAEQQGIPPEQIMVGNGTAEILWLLAFVTLTPNDKVLVIGPTFGEYKRNALLMGAHVIEWHARPEDDFAIQVDQIGETIAKHRPKLVHVCNPNNPTGQILSQETLAAWAIRWPSTLFVIDEAYRNFVASMPTAAALNLPNLLVLRSMTKDYALAGVRLGYALGSTDLIEGMARAQVPWSVNGLAQAAGIAAIGAHAEYEQVWQRMHGDHLALCHQLTQLGYRPHPSATHYFLMDVGNGHHWRHTLLKHGMLVRLCESYRLPAHVRIASRTVTENERLLHLLRHLNLNRLQKKKR